MSHEPHGSHNVAAVFDDKAVAWDARPLVRELANATSTVRQFYLNNHALRQRNVSFKTNLR